MSLGAADRSAARTLEAVLPPTEAVVNGARGDADEALNRARAAEYAALFKPEKLSPSNNEASLEIIIALLRGLDLQPTDRLLDLGSARGRVVLAAAATTLCALCGGAELSPCDHAAAERAREQPAKKRMRGRSKIGTKLRKKRKNIFDEERKKLQERLGEEKEAKQREREQRKTDKNRKKNGGPQNQKLKAHFASSSASSSVEIPAALTRFVARK